MSGKRKRGEAIASGASGSDSTSTAAKPISAIAAARLRAAAAANEDSTQDAVVQNVPQSPLVDASESDFAESEPEDTDPIVDRNFSLCNWRPNHPDTILSNTLNELTVSLEKHTTVALIGHFRLKVLKGAVNINGANISTTHRGDGHPNGCHVLVPSTYPITKIRGLDRANQVQIWDCGEFPPLERLSPQFANIWAAPDSESLRLGRQWSFQLITGSVCDPLSRPLVPENAPEDWLRAIEEITNKPSVTLVTGPSSSGKSTFAKRLLNRFLTGVGKSAKAVPAVCYLDLDPSNPEYTPEGQISLAYVTELNLSPSFVRPIHKASGRGDNQFVVAHPLPILNLPDYEEYFTSCVSALFKVFKDNLHDGDTTRPLIINTPPSLYTTHFPLLQSIIRLLKPNHIIHVGDITAIEPDTAVKLDTLQTLAKKSGTTLHELAAQFPPLPPARTASQRRAMQMQSYFHRAPANADDKTWDHGGMTWDTRPLSHFTPWELYYEETATRTQDLLGILPLFDALPPARLLTALNGSIIHIVETSCPTTQALYQKLPKTTQHGLPYFPADTATGMTQPLSPQTSKVVCTALIRGFDLDAKVIQIVVPTTHEPLLRTLTPEKTVFVAGCCDTPEWAYTEDAYAQLNARTNDAHLGGGSMKENVLTEGVELPPWVEKKSVMDGMGYLNTVRRVRKFLG